MSDFIAFSAPADSEAWREAERRSFAGKAWIVGILACFLCAGSLLFFSSWMDSQESWPTSRGA